MWGRERDVRRKDTRRVRMVSSRSVVTVTRRSTCPRAPASHDRFLSSLSFPPRLLTYDLETIIKEQKGTDRKLWILMMENKSLPNEEQLWSEFGFLRELSSCFHSIIIRILSYEPNIHKQKAMERTGSYRLYDFPLISYLIPSIPTEGRSGRNGWMEQGRRNQILSIDRSGLIHFLSSFMIIRCNRQAIVCRGVMKGLVKTGS